MGEIKLILLPALLAVLFVMAACGDEERRAPIQPVNPETEPALEDALEAAIKRLTPTPDPNLPRSRSRVQATPTLVPQVRLQGSSTGPPAGREVVVARVIDGDTIDAEFPNGSFQRIRLLGIDTPETDGQNRSLEYGNITNLDCLDRWGAAASEFTNTYLLGQRVTLVYDEWVPVRDTFGRLLAYVEFDGADFGAELVAQGLARVFTDSGATRESSYTELYIEAQND
ncbi:MAG: thermonuclease family protein, partial [Chloroflexi bacterium]|nr:thermonuclease family protein [Chloroflexota bacterium]